MCLSYLPVSRDHLIGVPNAAAQLIGAMHFLAAAKLIRSIIDGHSLTDLTCKGLLLKRKDQLFLYTETVSVKNVCEAALKVQYQDFHTVGSDSLTLVHLCAGIHKLCEH